MRISPTAPLFTLLCLVCLSLSEAEAARRDRGSPPPRAERVRGALPDVNPELAVSGKFDSRPKRGRSGTAQLQLTVRIPMAAPSLGISDPASAAAASIHVEFIRAGEAAPYNTCQLALHAPAESEDKLRYSLHAKAKAAGNTIFRRGSCSAAIDPASPLLKGDTIKVFAVTDVARIELLAK